MEAALTPGALRELRALNGCGWVQGATRSKWEAGCNPSKLSLHLLGNEMGFCEPRGRRNALLCPTRGCSLRSALLPLHFIFFLVLFLHQSFPPVVSALPAPLWNVHSPVPGWAPPNSRWLFLVFSALKIALPLFSECSLSRIRPPRSLHCFFPRGSLWISLLLGSSEQGVILKPQKHSPICLVPLGHSKEPHAAESFPLCPGRVRKMGGFKLILPSGCAELSDFSFPK